MSSEFNVIHCIGDSHASFFSGQNDIQPIWLEGSDDVIPFFKTYRLGAVLAYNLCKLGTRMRGREKLISLLDNFIPKGSTVMLCFGEIDCRAHLLKQAELQRRDLSEVVRKCVERYFSVILEIREKRYKVLVWNVIPSARADQIKNPEFPSYGNCLKRNKVTMLFNDYLMGLLKSESIPMISIYDKLIDKKGFTKRRYYRDEVHLSQRAMPLAIREIQKVVTNIDFNQYKYSFCRNCLTFAKIAMLSGFNLKRIVNISRNIFKLFEYPTGSESNRETIISHQVVRHELVYPIAGKIRRILSKFFLICKSSKRTLSPLFEKGFHGDKFLLQLVDSLMSQIYSFIETGCNIGTTARYVAKTYPDVMVYSCEIDEVAFQKVQRHLSGLPNAEVCCQRSPEFLYLLNDTHKHLRNRRNLFWLDAHGYGFRWPLRDEIAFITENFQSAVVIIDDFEVPGKPEFKSMKDGDQLCNFRYIESALAKEKKYWVIYPNYIEHTSPHHPLVGYVVIVFGMGELYLAENIRKYFSIAKYLAR